MGHLEFVMYLCQPVKKNGCLGPAHGNDALTQVIGRTTDYHLNKQHALNKTLEAWPWAREDLKVESSDI